MYSKMNLTKRILLPAFFAISLLVAACGGSNGSTSVTTTKAAANKQIYIRPYALSDLKTLDPPLETDLYSAQAINMVFSGLVEQDDSGKIQPELAQSYSLGSDNVTWTFHLRSGLKFSDGTPLTSADVVYSLDRALQPATKSSFASGYLGLIKDLISWRQTRLRRLSATVSKHLMPILLLSLPASQLHTSWSL